jgi:hypothetical protein
VTILWSVEKAVRIRELIVVRACGDFSHITMQRILESVVEITGAQRFVQV